MKKGRPPMRKDERQAAAETRPEKCRAIRRRELKRFPQSERRCCVACSRYWLWRRSTKNFSIDELFVDMALTDRACGAQNRRSISDSRDARDDLSDQHVRAAGCFVGGDIPAEHNPAIDL